jgi:hypothetical protein
MKRGLGAFGAKTTFEIERRVFLAPEVQLLRLSGRESKGG